MKVFGKKGTGGSKATRLTEALATELAEYALGSGTELGEKLAIMKTLTTFYSAVKRSGDGAKDGEGFDVYRTQLATGSGGGSGGSDGASTDDGDAEPGESSDEGAADDGEDGSVEDSGDGEGAVAAVGGDPRRLRLVAGGASDPE